MKTKIKTLKNKLRVMLIDTESFPSATCMLLVGAGSRYENKQNSGVAHFFEHMAFKGSKKYPDAFTISSIIDNLGGQFNAFTSNDHTGYYVKAPVEHFKSVITLLSDMIMHPLLKKEDIEREKGVIIEEINMGKDNPAREVFDTFEELIYKGNPLAMPTIGYKTTVNKFTQKTFKDYIESLYKPSNVLCVVAGGLSQKGRDMEFYFNEIEKSLGEWKDSDTLEYIPFKSNQTKPDYLINSKKTEQVHFTLGFRAFSFFDPRRYSLALLSAILGKGMSSRLFMEVREKRGLCYYIHNYTDQYADTGALLTHAGVRADVKQVQNAMKAIIHEHVDIKNGNVSKEELQKAKELLKGSMLLALEDTHNVASYFGRMLLLENKLEEPNTLIKAIESVTKDEVIALARELFSYKNLNIAVIGDITQKDVALDFDL